MINWNNMDTLASYAALHAAEPVKLAAVMSGVFRSIWMPEAVSMGSMASASRFIQYSSFPVVM